MMHSFLSLFLSLQILLSSALFPSSFPITSPLLLTSIPLGDTLIPFGNQVEIPLGDTLMPFGNQVEIPLEDTLMPFGNHVETASQSSASDALTASISAPSAVLMEASTGTIVYEKDSHAIRHPASITKIMTLILIFDAIEKGSIHLTDTVTVSEHASSMGGSQVFLEAGETQTVETMIKCISISSANDACVAL